MISKASAHWSIFEKTRMVLDSLNGYSKGILLDVGCGAKPFQEVFEGRTRHYFGLDIPSKIDRTNEKQRTETIDLYGECQILPVRTASLDTLLCSFVIEHVFEYDLLMDEACRVLKKEAHCYLVSPLLVAIHEAPYDFFRFTEYSLQRIAEKHGFEALHIVPVGGEFLFWGNRIATFLHKVPGFPMSTRIVEVLSYLIQRVSLFLDNRCRDTTFVCNYVCVLRKK